MKHCEWMFHMVTADGVMFGSRYVQRPGEYPTKERATVPCGAVPSGTPTEPDGRGFHRYELVRAVGDMVNEHCGEAYTVMWQGRAWSVELSSGYALWQTNG